MNNIVILSASSGKNLDLSNKLNKIVSDLGEESRVINLEDLDLPLYSSTKEAAGLPNTSMTLKDSIKNAKALIVVAPEYNGGVPPALTNAIAWVSRSGDDWRDAFNNKPMVLATHSGGGGSSVLAAMRLQLSFLGANILGRQILTNFGKPLNRESAITVVKQLIKYIG